MSNFVLWGKLTQVSQSLQTNTGINTFIQTSSTYIKFVTNILSSISLNAIWQTHVNSYGSVCPYRRRRPIYLYQKVALVSIAQQPLVGEGCLSIEDWESHLDTPYSVGLLRTSDQPDAHTSTTTHNTRKRQTSMPPAGFEPTFPASERLQTHYLDRAASVIGCTGLGISNFQGVKHRQYSPLWAVTFPEEVHLKAFLTLGIDLGKWIASRTSRFTLCEIASVTIG
jgi:hypothetical protein